MEMKPIDHKTCESCHDDPHKGSLGPACASCHTEDGLEDHQDQQGQDTSFHDKTKFPLRGGHIGVACKSCHGPFPPAGEFHGLPFAMQRLPRGRAPRPARRAAGRPAAACDACHAERVRAAALRARAARQDAFPLEGAHAVAACRGCHPIDERLAAQVPDGVSAKLARRTARWSSAWRCCIRRSRPQTCAGCHEDPHGGSSTTRSRRTTAAAATSVVVLRPDRSTTTSDSRFPLTGKHQTACAACHRPSRPGRGGGRSSATNRCRSPAAAATPTRTRGSSWPARSPPTASRAAAEGCDFCHQTPTFKTTASSTTTPLHDVRARGQAREVPVRGLPPAVTLPPMAGVKTVRYRPVPRACEDCHVDFHHGDFKGFEP